MKVNTNSEFAQAVGCSPSMASRLRTGNRLPSASLLSRICRAFRIAPAVAMRRRDAGKASFAELLAERCYRA